jgi:hypothetical protein
MAGINIPNSGLGQGQRTVPQGRIAKVFDKGFAFSIVLVVLVAGIWGVLWLLGFLIDREITGYHSAVESSLASVNQSDTAAIEDFSTRADIAKETLAERVQPLDMLALLEKDTLPSVSLVNFEQNADDGLFHISGVTSDYRYVAEQVLRYRQEEAFQNISVTGSNRNEEGQIQFELTVSGPKEPEVQAVPVPNPATL